MVALTGKADPSLRPARAKRRHEEKARDSVRDDIRFSFVRNGEPSAKREAGF